MAIINMIMSGAKATSIRNALRTIHVMGRGLLSGANVLPIHG
jgi:hypothetical protein